MTDERPTAVIEFLGDPPPGLTALVDEFPSDVTLLEAKGFGAIDPSLQALIVLTPPVSLAIAKIVVAHIAAKHSVKIKANGVEVEGVDADKAVAIIESLGSMSPTADDP